MSKYLLIMVTLTGFETAKVDVIGSFDTISDCHVAMTMATFKQNPDNYFCFTTRRGVDWSVK
jgi:hypothetical protein